MKITALRSNQTLVSYSNGTDVFVSYSTPVAAFVPGVGYLRTKTKYSVTTSKHITQWLGGRDAEEVEQELIDRLANGEAL